MAALVAKAGDVVVELACCGDGARLVLERQVREGRCPRCSRSATVLARVVLGAGGAVPPPEDWERLEPAKPARRASSGRGR